MDDALSGVFPANNQKTIGMSDRRRREDKGSKTDMGRALSGLDPADNQTTAEAFERRRRGYRVKN